jgi:hypothetical protein
VFFGRIIFAFINLLIYPPESFNLTNDAFPEVIFTKKYSREFKSVLVCILPSRNLQRDVLISTGNKEFIFAIYLWCILYWGFFIKRNLLAKRINKKIVGRRMERMNNQFCPTISNQEGELNG